MAFKKGSIPWNKEKKGIHLSPKSEFKKGAKSWNEGRAFRASCLECGKPTSQWNTRDKPVRCRPCRYKIAFTVKEHHPRWIKDRAQLKERSPRGWDGKLSYEYINWMKQVKNRDYWKCRIANDDCSGRVEAHHILNWVQYPELRFEIKNGITLCHAHHPRKRAEEKRLVPFFMELVSVSK